MYAVRNKVPDPSVGYTELVHNKEVCSRTVRFTTNLHVFDDAADKCREYITIIPEGDLIDADGFTAFYRITGRGPEGMTSVFCISVANVRGSKAPFFFKFFICDCN